MPFDEKPLLGEPRAEDTADDFSRLFSALEQPRPSPETHPFAPPAMPAKASDPAPRNPSAASPSEFTQVFRQIAKPTSRPPDLDALASPATAASPGEFTQFFSSMEAAAASAPALPVARVPPATVEAAPTPRSPLASPPGTAVAAVDAGSFTQVFGQSQGAGRVTAPSFPLNAYPEQPMRGASPLPFAEAPSIAPLPKQNEPRFGFEEQRAAPPAASAGEPSASAVTQIFQMEPSSGFGAATPPIAARPVPPSPVAAVGPDPHEFTRLMQELGATPAAESPAGPGEFTRLMQSLEGSSSQGVSVSPLPIVPPVAHPPQAANAHVGAREFTRLMQSLSSTSAAPASMAAQPVMTLQSAAPAMAGESEYTRIVRGSARREGGAVSQDVAVAAAPSVRPKAETAKDKCGVETGTKPSKWLLILLVSNAVLLLVLIVLVVLFLQHRH